MVEAAKLRALQQMPQQNLLPHPHNTKGGQQVHSSTAPTGNNSGNNKNNCQGLLDLPEVSIHGSLTSAPDDLYHTDQHSPRPTANDPVTNYIPNHNTAEQTFPAMTLTRRQFINAPSTPVFQC